METQVQVVKRDTIQPLEAVNQNGDVHVVGELRDFRWNDDLRKFMSISSTFSASWVSLKQGEVLQTHTHPADSMMVVYAGSGDMLGDFCGPLAEGDVIFVPAGRRHGFVAGKEGIYALSIQFGEGLYTKPEKPRVIFADSENSLSSLIAYNERRAADFSMRPVFRLLDDGTLGEPGNRNAFFAALRVVVDGLGKALVSCHANCADPRHESAFLERLEGHLSTHRNGDESSQVRSRDPILQAIVDWFAYQMYVLDDAEKAAIVYFVAESAEFVCREYAARVRRESGIPVESNVPSRAARGAELLRHETLQTYERLRRVVREAWDMVDEASDRILEITLSAR